MEFNGLDRLKGVNKGGFVQIFDVQEDEIDFARIGHESVGNSASSRELAVNKLADRSRVISVIAGNLSLARTLNEQYDLGNVLSGIRSEAITNAESGFKALAAAEEAMERHQRQSE